MAQEELTKKRKWSGPKEYIYREAGRAGKEMEHQLGKEYILLGWADFSIKPRLGFRYQ